MVPDPFVRREPNRVLFPFLSLCFLLFHPFSSFFIPFVSAREIKQRKNLNQRRTMGKGISLYFFLCFPFFFFFSFFLVFQFSWSVPASSFKCTPGNEAATTEGFDRTRPKKPSRTNSMNRRIYRDPPVGTLEDYFHPRKFDCRSASSFSSFAFFFSSFTSSPTLLLLLFLPPLPLYTLAVPASSSQASPPRRSQLYSKSTRHG